MPYYLIRESLKDDTGYGDIAYTDPSDKYPEYAHVEYLTRADAHAALLAMNRVTPDEPIEKLAIVYLVDSSTARVWRNRERARMESGTYAPIPWQSRDRFEDHYCHLSRTHPGLVAYTPDDEYGMQDRQIRLTPGKYLQRFYAGLFSAEQIEDYVSAVKAHAKLRYTVTTDADTIECVYLNGPSSCMSHDTRTYRTGGIHPARVYSGGDLAVAYIGDADDRVTARAVIWPDKKTYSRVYGDTTLTHLLVGDGYTQGWPDGARVRAIRISGNRYVMPYVDGIGYAERDDAFFILGDGDYDTQHTNGTTADDDQYDDEDEDELYVCSHCDAQYHPDDSQSGTYCQSCYDDLAVCHYCDAEWIDHRGNATEINGFTVCEECADARSHECVNPDCGDTYHTDNRGEKDTLCDDCAPKYRVCAECDHVFERDLDTCPQCQTEVRERCDRTMDLLLAAAAADAADTDLDHPRNAVTDGDGYPPARVRDA